jgi:hypothetical protein
MGHDVWDSQRNRDINRSKDTVTDHWCEDYRYHSITRQATIKDHKSRLFTALQDSILLEYDIVSLGKRFQIFFVNTAPSFSRVWKSMKKHQDLLPNDSVISQKNGTPTSQILSKTIKMHLTKLWSVVIISGSYK